MNNRITNQEYKKIAKHYAPAERFFLQRVGDAVYITDGFSAIKLHVAAYNEHFRTACPRYVELNDGDAVTVDKNLNTAQGMQIIIPFNDYFNPRNTIRREYNGNIKELTNIYTGGRTRKTHLAAVMEAAGLDDLYLNYEWFITLRPLFGDTFIAGGDGDAAPVKTEQDEYTGALILPIRK